MDNKDRFRVYLSTFENKRIELVLRERNTGRSDEANRYYWGIVIEMISEHTGHTPDETHEILKEKFHVESTAKLKTGEFQEYVTKIVRFAASELNLAIPDPGQVDY